MAIAADQGLVPITQWRRNSLPRSKTWYSSYVMPVSARDSYIAEQTRRP